MSLYLGIRPSNTPYNVAQFKKSFECCNYITAAQAPETVRALCMQRHPAMSTLQFGPAGCRQGRGKLRPPIERIGPLAGFGLDKLPDDRDPLGFAEAPICSHVRRKSQQLAPTLSRSADQQRDCLQGARYPHGRRQPDDGPSLAPSAWTRAPRRVI
jgi:hypothetical protein